MGLAQFLARCVDIHLVSGLSVHHLEQSHVGQFFGTRIIDLNSHHIVFAVGNLHLFGEVFAVVEVTDDEGSAVAFHHAGEVGRGHPDVRACALRMEVEHLTDDVKDMLASILWRNILLYTVGEEDDTDLVIVLNGRESDRRSDFCSQLALHLLRSTEVQRPRDVDEQHHRELTLLLKDLDIRMVEAGRDVPVNIPDIVAELIFTHLGESHTLAFKGRVVLSREDVLTQSPGFDLYLSDLM